MSSLTRYSPRRATTTGSFVGRSSGRRSDGRGPWSRRRAAQSSGAPRAPAVLFFRRCVDGQVLAANPRVCSDHDRLSERCQFNAGLRAIDQNGAAELHERVRVERTVVGHDEDVRWKVRVSPNKFRADRLAIAGLHLVRMDSHDQLTVGSGGEVVDREEEPLEHVLEGVALVVELRVPENVRQQAEGGARGIQPDGSTRWCCSCSSGRSAASGVTQAQSPLPRLRSARKVEQRGLLRRRVECPTFDVVSSRNVLW